MREGQRVPGSGEGSSLGHAIALFLSMGFSFAGSVVGALMLGDYLVKRTGQQFWYIIMLVLGLVGGVSVVYRLLQPLMKSNK